MDFLQNKFFLIALTFGFYLGGQLLQRRTGIKLLNPILIAIAAMISFLLTSSSRHPKRRGGQKGASVSCAQGSETLCV